MQTIGLLFLPEPAPAPLLVGGISVVDRQARLLRRAGAERLLAVDVVPLTVLPAGVEAVATAALPGLIGRDDRVVVLAAGLVADERCLAAVLAVPAPALLVADGTAVPLRGVERLDALSFAAGVMVLPGMMVREVAATLGDWDLGSTLIRAAATNKATTRIDIAAIPLYALGPAARCAADLGVADERSRGDDRNRRGDGLGAEGLSRLAGAVYPPADRKCAGAAAGADSGDAQHGDAVHRGRRRCAGIVAFAMGWLWTGLILALITGPLDGVDGKLARTTRRVFEVGRP